MARPNTKEILYALLTGSELESGTLEALKSIPEDQFFDAKSGKTEKFTEVVREYVSAFANAEGGFLVVGLTDTCPRQVEPLSLKKNSPLEDWASEACKPLLAYPSSARPVFKVYVVDGQPVLFVAIGRCEESLLPTFKNGRPVYCMRGGSLTVELSPETVADILYGRRNRPVLGVSISTDNVGAQPQQVIGDIPVVGLSFVFSIENLGFVDADNVEVGVIGWTCVDPSVKVLNGHLARFIELQEPRFDTAFRHRLKLSPLHRRTSKNSRGTENRDAIFVPAFESRPTHGTGEFHLPLCQGKTTFAFAAYLRFRGGMPLWHQLTVTSEYTGWAQTPGSTIPISDHRVLSADISPVLSGRPQLSIKFEPARPYVSA